MTHHEKVERVIRELNAKGVSPLTTAPPLFRAAWAAGVRVPPPFFIGFLPLFVVMAGAFGAPFGLFLWIAQRWTIALPVRGLVLVSACGGALFGPFMASYSRWKARRLGLPSWREYGEA
jgi:hypothetical protein